MTARAFLPARRLAAILLLGVAAARAFAPVADALAEHREPAPHALIHLNRPGACNSHAEHCALRCSCGDSRWAAGLTPRLDLSPPAFAAAPSAPEAPALRSTHSPHCSRAPPFALA